MILYVCIIVILNLVASVPHPADPADGVKMTVEGLVPATYTPLDDAGNLKLSIIPQYAKYLKENHVDGILLAGRSGEGPGLTLDERKKLLDAWMLVTKPLGLKVVMQVGGQPFAKVLEMARYAEDVGVDAILSLPDLYFKPKNDSAIVDYLKIISDAVPTLPILYYHHPEMSGVNINCAKFYLEATDSISNFKGLKCDFQCALNILATGHFRNDHKLFMTSHMTMASNLLMGINSSMSGSISIYPKLFRRIEEAVSSNDLSMAKQLQLELNERLAVITANGHTVSCIKAAMELVTGIQVGYPREPLKHLSDLHITAMKEGLLAIDAKHTET